MTGKKPLPAKAGENQRLNNEMALNNNKLFVWLGAKHAQPLCRELWTLQAVCDIGAWVVVL